MNKMANEDKKWFRLDYCKDGIPLTDQQVVLSSVKDLECAPDKKAFVVSFVQESVAPSNWEAHVVKEEETLKTPDGKVLKPEEIVSAVMKRFTWKARKAAFTIAGKPSPNAYLLKSRAFPNVLAEWFDFDANTITFFAQKDPNGGAHSDQQAAFQRAVDAKRAAHVQVLERDYEKRIDAAKGPFFSSQPYYLNNSYYGWKQPRQVPLNVTDYVSLREKAFMAGDAMVATSKREILGSLGDFINGKRSHVQEKCARKVGGAPLYHAQVGKSPALDQKLVDACAVTAETGILVRDAFERVEILVNHFKIGGTHQYAPQQACLTISVIEPSNKQDQLKKPFFATSTEICPKEECVKQKFATMIPFEEFKRIKDQKETAFPKKGGYVLLVRSPLHHKGYASIPKYILANVEEKRCVEKDSQDVCDKGAWPKEFYNFEEAQEVIKKESDRFGNNFKIERLDSPSNKWLQVIITFTFYAYCVSYLDDAWLAWNCNIFEKSTFSMADFLLVGGDNYKVYRITDAHLFKRKVEVFSGISAADPGMAQLITRPSANQFIPGFNDQVDTVDKTTRVCIDETQKLLGYELDPSQRQFILSLGKAYHEQDKLNSKNQKNGFPKRREAPESFVMNVDGPPGCGKTDLVTFAARFTNAWWDLRRPLQAAQYKVLIVAEKNSAVSNAVQKAKKLYRPCTEEETCYFEPVAQIGRHESKFGDEPLPKLHQRSLELKLCELLYPGVPYRMLTRDHLQAALASRIIGCTIDSLLKTMKHIWNKGGPNKIRLCIVDEASTLSRFSLLILALLQIETLIFVGDLKQLPVYGNHLTGPAAPFNISPLALFNELLPTVETFKMNYHYRCHFEVFSHFSRYNYDDRLKHSRKIIAEDNAPVYLIFDVQQSEEEKCRKAFELTEGFTNPKEAAAGIEILLAYCAAEFGDDPNKWVEKLKAKDPEGVTRGLCLMSPYCGQVDLLSQYLVDYVRWPDLEYLAGYPIQIRTTDSCQGEEYDCVIVSAVRTASVGFLDNELRNNVLCSCARDHLYIVCNSKTFEKKGGEYWRHLLDDAHARGCLVEVPSGKMTAAELVHLLDKPNFADANLSEAEPAPSSITLISASFVAPNVVYYLPGREAERRVTIVPSLDREMKTTIWTRDIDTGSLEEIEKWNLLLPTVKQTVLKPANFKSNDFQKSITHANATLGRNLTLEDIVVHSTRQLNWKVVSGDACNLADFISSLLNAKPPVSPLLRRMTELRHYYGSLEDFLSQPIPKASDMKVDNTFVAAISIQNFGIGFFDVAIVKVGREITLQCTAEAISSLKLSMPHWGLLRFAPTSR